MRRGDHGGPTTAATLRTGRRRACARDERELAVLAEVDALLNESRVYLAFRDGPETWVDVVAGHGADRERLDVAAPDWGRRGGGALRLAFAILGDVLGRAVHIDLARAFADEVLHAVAASGFAITAVDVRGWVLFHAAVEVPDRWT
jgi:hypothetical protein